VRMPGMDGFETAAHIRRRQQSEMTPIIFITAHAKNEVLNSDLYVEGAVDVMFPPVSPVELRAKVSVFANLFIRAQELAERARAVQTSAEELKFLTDVTPIGIFRVDAQKRYVYTNPRWAEIFGISSDDAVGRVWGANVGLKPLAGSGLERGDTPANQSELGERFELRIPGAASRILLVTSKAILDSDGRTAGWVGTVADVTAEAEAEAAMAEARDEANEASRLKSDFLANMSHEIRTPMNGVIGMTELLLETDLDDRQRDYAQTVQSSGEALLTIINDILDFSKIEAGQLEVEDIEFSLRSIVDDVVDLLAGPARTKGLGLAAEIAPSVPAVVSGDPGRVRQVLTNLVGNAIKFTQAGEVVVRVTEETAAGDETIVRFEVADTGDGIASDKLAVIFEPFVQADTSTSRKYGGTGLGLAISGQLVGLMRGDCGVSSTLGAGSTFWFTIRVQTVARPAPQVVDAVTTTTGGSSPRGRLLLAEDNLTNQKVAVAMLSGAGYLVDTVLNGAAAVKAVAAQSYDAILMDCQMPELNGYEATAAIRAAEGSGRRTPIIAMTAGARREDSERCLAGGMDAYLAKPISKGGLLALVARAVQGEPVVVAEPRRWVPIGSGDEPVIDQDVFNELYVLGSEGDAAFLSDLVKQFVDKTRLLLVELRAALEAGDTVLAGRIAHNIKGGCSQLGGRRLASACGRLESKARASCLADGQVELAEIQVEYDELSRTLRQRIAPTDPPRSRLLSV
ncbi:MAG: two-component system, sensor histidine kinase and response regulator, partial [Solirubrobacteraceae bacterium]|nr:two-component system, sensor histidine kinase and response regulator [Solirubrobacteraceae bacterium]